MNVRCQPILQTLQKSEDELPVNLLECHLGAVVPTTGVNLKELAVCVSGSARMSRNAGGVSGSRLLIGAIPNHRGVSPWLMSMSIRIQKPVRNPVLS